jgi:hypothetical protein
MTYDAAVIAGGAGKRGRLTIVGVGYRPGTRLRKQGAYRLRRLRPRWLPTDMRHLPLEIEAGGPLLAPS